MIRAAQYGEEIYTNTAELTFNLPRPAAITFADYDLTSLRPAILAQQLGLARGLANDADAHRLRSHMEDLLIATIADTHITSGRRQGPDQNFHGYIT